jgi:hypothetical protein
VGLFELADYVVFAADLGDVVWCTACHNHQWYGHNRLTVEPSIRDEERNPTFYLVDLGLKAMLALWCQFSCSICNCQEFIEQGLLTLDLFAILIHKRRAHDIERLGRGHPLPERDRRARRGDARIA